MKVGIRNTQIAWQPQSQNSSIKGRFQGFLQSAVKATSTKATGRSNGSAQSAVNKFSQTQPGYGPARPEKYYQSSYVDASTAQSPNVTARYSNYVSSVSQTRTHSATISTTNPVLKASNRGSEITGVIRNVDPTLFPDGERTLSVELNRIIPS